MYAAEYASAGDEAGERSAASTGASRSGRIFFEWSAMDETTPQAMGTRPHKTARAACLALSFALLGHPCAAEERPPWRGFELSASTGIAGFLVNAPSPFTESPGALFAWSAHLGARVTRRVAFGLHLGGTLGGASELSDDSSVTGLSGGLYLRIYLARDPERLGWDPWLGIGIDILARTLSSRETPDREVRSLAVVEKGFSLPLSFGVDYRLTERIAVGALTTLEARAGEDACLTTATATETDRACRREIGGLDWSGRGPGFSLAWSAAVQVRFSLPR